MTDKLPHPELFPYLHPLKQIDVKKYPIIKPVVSEFVKEHDYYLDEYLDSLKLTKSIEYLLEQGLEKSIKQFDITTFKQAVGPLHIGTSKQECWVVWVFIAAAFMLINRAIAENTTVLYETDIRVCFKNAHDYKRLWHERKSRYQGADKTNEKRAKKRKEDLRIIKELKDNNLDDTEIFKGYNKIVKAKKKRPPVFGKPSSFTRNDSRNAITQAITVKK